MLSGIALSAKCHRIDLDTMMVKMFLPGVTEPVVSSTIERQETKQSIALTFEEKQEAETWLPWWSVDGPEGCSNGS